MSKSKKFSHTEKVGRVTIRKRADSGIWYVYYKLPTGIWRDRSLATNSKKEAVRQAEVLSSKLLNQKCDIADGTAPLQLLANEFFMAKNGRNKPESIKRLTSSWHVFKRWLDEAYPQVHQVKGITNSMVRQFQEYRVEVAEVEESTVDKDIKNMNTIFRWGERESYVERSPFDYSRNGNIDLYDPPEPELDTYSWQEYRNLLSECVKRGRTLIRDLIIVLAGTGMRFSEASNLRPSSLHWDSDIPYLEIRAHRSKKHRRRSKGWSPKDKHEVKRIPMSEDVEEVLRRRLEECDGKYIFQNRNGNVVANNHALVQLKSLFSAAGITDDRRLHWHSFRNFFIIRCLDRDKPVPVNRIMQWTGHDCVSLVLHYAKARTDDHVGFDDFRSMRASNIQK